MTFWKHPATKDHKFLSQSNKSSILTQVPHKEMVATV